MRAPFIRAAAGLALTLSVTAQGVAQYHPYAQYVRPYRQSGTPYEPGPAARPLPTYDPYVVFDEAASPPPAPGDEAASPPFAPAESPPPPVTGWTTPAAPCPKQSYFPQPCDCECFEGGCFGGIEFAFLRPRFADNTAIVVDPPPDDNFVLPFDYDFETTPRVWLGHVNCDGFGWQARYWRFDGEGDTRSFSPTADAPLASVFVFGAGGNISRNAFAGIGETLTVSHDLEIDVFDLEAVQRWQWRRMLLMGSFGARYVRMDQDFLATAITAAGVLDEMVDHQHSFEGFGPVVGLQLTRPLGDSNFGVYGNVRGSILFGDQDQSITEVKMAGAAVGRDTHSGDEVMAIGEIGFGVQYAHVSCSGALRFVRLGYESQIWWDAGGPINTDGNMGLEGFALAFGVYR
jgi:Legionella pneumophila major outer membrane protein precursor